MISIWSKPSLAGACLLAALSINAAPLQRADVAAESKWLVHVDCDRLRSTTVGQYVVAELEKPDAKNKLSAFQAMFKFDLRTQLHGLTLYNVGDASDEGVLLVYADFDSAHLATLAKGANDYKGSTHNQHEIHSWIDNSNSGKHHSSKRTYAGSQGNRVLVFGQREASVAHALDVMDLSAANLTATKGFPALEGGAAFLQAAALKLSVGGSDANAAVFRLSKSLKFDMGEEQQKVTARLQLSASDDDVARQIASVGEGLISLMKLQRDRPEASKLANALSLKQDANDVVVSFSIPAGDAVAFLKADAARRARKEQ